MRLAVPAGARACETIRRMSVTVLIVDDHPSFRATARLLLESEGFDVVGEAADGAAGLRDARALEPDLVLLDVQLPDIDGFEVAAQLTGAGGGAGRRAHLEPRRGRLRPARGRRAARAASSPRPSSPAPRCWPLWSRYDRYPRARMTVDLVVATPTFLDLTFVGLEGLPAPGRGALRRRSRPLARRRRDHGRRRRPARALDGARRAARRRRRGRLRARRAGERRHRPGRRAAARGRRRRS